MHIRKLCIYILNILKYTEKSFNFIIIKPKSFIYNQFNLYTKDVHIVFWLINKIMIIVGVYGIYYKL